MNSSCLSIQTYQIAFAGPFSRFWSCPGVGCSCGASAGLVRPVAVGVDRDALCRCGEIVASSTCHSVGYRGRAFLSPKPAPWSEETPILKGNPRNGRPEVGNPAVWPEIRGMAGPEGSLEQKKSRKKLGRQRKSSGCPLVFFT